MNSLSAKGSPSHVEIRDEDALSGAVEAQRGRLMAFIESGIRDHNEAEDVFQEVLEEYTEAFALGEVIESLGAWLTQVARRKIIDRFRRRKTQAAYQAESGKESEAFSPDQPDEVAERLRLRALIVEALEALPSEQREVFVKNELEGKTFAEISAESGVGVNTLLSRKRYAVLFLREFLKEVYDELK